MEKYRYYCPKQPPSLETIPIDTAIILEIEAFPERQYVSEIDLMVWGWVEYDRPLSPREVAKYRLRSAPREVE